MKSGAKGHIYFIGDAGDPDVEVDEYECDLATFGGQRKHGTSECECEKGSCPHLESGVASVALNSQDVDGLLFTVEETFEQFKCSVDYDIGALPRIYADADNAESDAQRGGRRPRGRAKKQGKVRRGSSSHLALCGDVPTQRFGVDRQMCGGSVSDLRGG